MKPLAWVGIVLIVLGIASLFVGIPRKESSGINAGGVKMGVEVTTNEKVSPIISGVLIIAGAGLIFAGRRA